MSPLGTTHDMLDDLREARLRSLETRAEEYDRAAALVVKLEAELANYKKTAKGVVKKAALWALGVVAGGALGTLVAIKGHYVDQGRELERARAVSEYARELECRVRRLEGRDCLAPYVPGVIRREP